MPKPKNPQPEDETQELTRRVDEMLDPKREPHSGSGAQSGINAPPPLDIFKDAPQPAKVATAPELPGEPAAETVDKPASVKKPRPKPEPMPEEPAPNETPAETVPKTQDKSEQQPAEADEAIESTSTNLDDKATDQAVDDIAAKEADTMLAVQDAVNRKKSQPKQRSGLKDRLRRLFGGKKAWLIVIALLIILFGVPFTRYRLLGLVIKKSVTVMVIDSQTATPVSNAQVKLAGREAKTDNNGRAKLSVRPGPDDITVSKQYYKTHTGTVSVGLMGSSAAEVRLVATGRQVPITVFNSISGEPLANAEIKALKTTAKTDAKGKATIVLPTGAARDKGIVSLKGYNSAKISVIVTSRSVAANSFKLTPSGQVYFLSNQGGTIDVVKTNLDGSGRQTVLAGTGREDSTTRLLASRDWHYLVLKARRNGSLPALFLINTSNGKLTPFDTNNASFNLIGWQGHNFIYDIFSNTTSLARTGHEAIKSYDADHLQLNQLDQAQSEGTPANYAYQDFHNFNLVGSLLTYSVQWDSATGRSLNHKTDGIRSVQTDGYNRRDLLTIASTGATYIQSAVYRPQTIYYSIYNNLTGLTKFYSLQGQSVTVASNLSQSDLDKAYPSYIVSPSGDRTFWSELRDGKDAMLIGDTNAQSGQQIAALSAYAPYGWFSDQYVLVTKDNSQLYILPAAGLKDGRQPVKVADYYQPSPAYGHDGL